MSILERLQALGFVNSEIIGQTRGLTTARIRTSKGWTYERFTDADEVDAWAVGKLPE